MTYQQQGDDPLAYGEDYNQSRGGPPGQNDRSLVGDAYKKIKSRYDQHQAQSGGQNYGYSSSGSNQGYYGQQPASTGYVPPGQSPYPGGPPQQRPGQKPGMEQKLFGALHNTVQNIGSDLGGLLGTQYQRPPSQYQPQGQQTGAYPTANQSAYSSQQGLGKNRYDSFACEKLGNDVKWYVDGCGYFWAVSQALERARESIWILDWWLSPELYLRRPPSQNEQWRLDRVLGRAAQRGVKINVIVYKEVTQALTLSSAHTKHSLEALHPNIAVFRHPDHLPDAQTAQSSLVSSLQGLKLDAAGLTKLGSDALKGVYGITDDVILYWAHHEKLCVVDGQTAFMGGLDMCFGRWDTNQHSIADVHSTDLNKITVPGQDYNNARIMDFNDVAHPLQNKLDRTKSSRMGWSDISISLHGSCVDDLRHHFVDRWNFIYDEKYNVRQDRRYTRIIDEFGHSADHPLPTLTHSQKVYHGLAPPQNPGQAPVQSQQYGVPIQQQQSQYVQPQPAYPPPPGSQPYIAPAWQSTQRPHTPNTGGLSPQPTATALPVSHSPDLRPSSSGYEHQQPPPAAQYNFPPPPPGLPPTTETPPYPQDQYHPQQPQAQPYQSELSAQPPEHRYQAGQYVDPQATSAQSYQAPSENQPQQPQYQAYGASQPQGQSTQGQNPYEHHSYQVPPGSQTRGLNEDRGSEEYQGGPEYDSGSQRGFGDNYSDNRSFGGQYKQHGKQFGSELQSIGNMVYGGIKQKAGQHGSTMLGPGGNSLIGRPLSQNRGPMICQVLRSCTTWSNGTPTEHSIQNAYCDVIAKSMHFVYIENQFFITATGDKQKPVENLIGKALVDRIIRAARNGEKYKVIVVIPAVPGFAGDLRDDGSLGTRAIMEFQYNSINRGGNSIMELIAQAGYNPMDYIRFYNLRNYDRINAGGSMSQVQQQSGVRYEDARKQHDDMVGAGYGGQGYNTGAQAGVPGQQYQQYQNTAQQYAGKSGAGRWDTVAECYMLGGTDIRYVPWDGPPESELDAFVSEELYIHSKVTSTTAAINAG